jgi:hypothetical protein
MALVDRSATQKASVFDAGSAFVLENTVSTVVATTADVVKVLDIPKGYFVALVYATIVTAADGGTSQVGDIGDPGGANSWDNDINLKAAQGTRTVSLAGTDAYVPAGKGVFPLDAKAYPTGGVINLTVILGGTVPTVGSVKIQALCFKPLLSSY